MKDSIKKTGNSKLRLSISVFLILSLISINNLSNAQPIPQNAKKIKIALLLDTSNSMDGLIDQAKSQLWTIVNELAKAKCDNLAPKLEIALYEYGNSNLPSTEGYIRMVTSLTSDLDKISEDLFSLTTNGGQEYCGQVISTACKELNWLSNSGDLQLIFIAGNEPFTQGTVPYSKACTTAKSKNIIVNTIFCGDFKTGINTSWQSGAILTGGSYMSINHNSKTVYIESPYDDRINALNQSLNDTYIPYGKRGSYYKENQTVQDKNANSYSKSNMAQRAYSKSQYVYENSSWDLVDASKSKSFDITKIETEYLPDNMKKMTVEQRKEYIALKNAEREKIKAEIIVLSKKREAYTADKRKKMSETNTLDNTMLAAIRMQAKAKNFVFE